MTINLIEDKSKNIISTWKIIGAMTDTTSLNDASFCLNDLQGKSGDIIAIITECPENYKKNKKKIIVWGQITQIKRANAVLANPILHQIAETGTNLNELHGLNLPGNLMTIADIKVLGCSEDKDLSKSISIKPLSYALKPGAFVYKPDIKTAQNLLFYKESDRAFRIGSLLSNSKMKVVFDAEALFTHAYVGGRTKSGKTNLNRGIMYSCAKMDYPILAFDPHGDFLAFKEKENKILPNTKVKVFYPRFSINDRDGIFLHIEKLGLPLTDPQQDYLERLIEIENFKGNTFKSYIESLIATCNNNIEHAQRRNEIPTIRVVRRCLGTVLKEIIKMETENELNRKRLKEIYKEKNLSHIEFEPMPDPYLNPEEFIKKGQITIMYMTGYRDRTQSVICSIILEALFKLRIEDSKKVPPFACFLEECHRFCPSSKMSSRRNDDIPSLHTIRRIVQEGRKFGVGLVVSSQSPSQVDDLTLAQCSTFYIGQLSNRYDIQWLSRILENWDQTCENYLPKFGTGQAYVTGNAFKFPQAIMADYFSDLEPINRLEGHDEKIKKWSSNIKKDQEKEKNNNEINKIVKLDTRKGN
tara:strand:- start:567 stop:2318 length:1752 start_codon:yes stop_codon:yes gene_type:complete